MKANYNISKLSATVSVVDKLVTLVASLTCFLSITFGPNKSGQYNGTPEIGELLYYSKKMIKNS